MSAAAIEQKIAEIESEMARTQKNKATEHHFGLLKAKIAKLKKDLMTLSSKSSGGGGEGFGVKKSGDACVGLVGFPSVGKSTLLTKLTGVESEAAAYEFTTLTCIPGQFKYKGCNIQLLDLPGIIEGANDNKGRGRQVIGVLRTCDLLLMCLDVTKPLQHKRVLEQEMEGFGIRINKKPPKIKIKKLDKGPVNIIKIVKQTNLTDKMIEAICKEFRYTSCEVVLREDATLDSLIDVLEGNRKYVTCIYILNKIDQISIEELDILARIPLCVPISGKDEWNLDGLMEMIWKELKMIRIYPKPKGQIPDFNEPVILPKNHCTILDFANKIHKNIAENLDFAFVWGQSAKFSPQKVGKNHELMDEDVVQLIKK
jgi:small GTP-binding protein